MWNLQIRKFISYFVGLFILNMTVNLLFKGELNLITALAVAFGFSGGIVFLGPYLYTKVSKD